MAEETEKERKRKGKKEKRRMKGERGKKRGEREVNNVNQKELTHSHSGTVKIPTMRE